MRYLLDTHVWLWMWGEPQKLRNDARAIIEAPANALLVSAASAWEIATKAAAGRLRLTVSADEWLSDPRHLDDVEELPINLAHATRAGVLPALHRDPFDRILVAQAQLEDLAIITADPQIAAYEVQLVGA